MKFAYCMKPDVYFGAGCVKERDWCMGTRAYVVTGAHSGRASGALEDVEAALRAKGIPYEAFEGIENNPSLEQCRELGARAHAFQADFIVAIGGGSPLDAAKAIAVFALTPEIETETLFQNAYTMALPIVAIPTTSGTGSEVTPFSVLTRRDMETKKSFGSALSFPAIALLDPGYTRSLSRRVTLHTAMDAFTHCLESFLSKRATPVSDALALEGLRRFGPCMQQIEADTCENAREELMLISMLGGMAIAQTGTTMMHAMGYPLTYYKGLAHGEANCAVMKAYLGHIARVSPERLSHALGALGMSREALCDYLERSLVFDFVLTEEEIAHYAAQSMKQGSTGFTPGDVTAETIAALYKESCRV